jgi:hypothetical protein
MSLADLDPQVRAFISDPRVPVGARPNGWTWPLEEQRLLEDFELVSVHYLDYLEGGGSAEFIQWAIDPCPTCLPRHVASHAEFENTCPIRLDRWAGPVLDLHTYASARGEVDRWNQPTDSE